MYVKNVQFDSVKYDATLNTFQCFWLKNSLIFNYIFINQA